MCIAEGGRALAFAGLWDDWEGEQGALWPCTIITKEAPAPFREIHPRMPVILSTAECRQWLDHTSDTDTLDDLIHYNNPLPLQVTPVDKSINNARNKAPVIFTGDTLKIEE